MTLIYLQYYISKIQANKIQNLMENVSWCNSNSTTRQSAIQQHKANNTRTRTTEQNKQQNKGNRTRTTEQGNVAKV